MAEAVRREICVLLRGQYERSVSEFCLVGRGVVELSPSSLCDSPGCTTGSVGPCAGLCPVAAAIEDCVSRDVCSGRFRVRLRL